MFYIIAFHWKLAEKEISERNRMDTLVGGEGC